MSWRKGEWGGEAEGWLCAQISIEVNTRVSMLFVREKERRDKWIVSFSREKRESEREEERARKRERKEIQVRF